MSKLNLYLLILITSTFCYTLKINARDELKSQEEFKASFGIGAGPSYGIWGITGLFDIKKYAGVDLVFAPHSKSINLGMNLRGNFFLNNKSIMMSPTLCLGHREGKLPFTGGVDVQAFYSSFLLTFRAYLTKNLFLSNSLGYEIYKSKYSFNNDYHGMPSVGVALGYTFRNAYNSQNWTKRNTRINTTIFVPTNIVVAVATAIFTNIFAQLE